MSFSYTKLWVLLVQRGMTKEQLRVSAGLSSATIARMGKNSDVSMDVLGKICKTLNCGVEDIVEYIPDSEKEKR